MTLRSPLPLVCGVAGLLLLSAGGLTGCASVARRVEIRSEPSGADVTTLEGEKMGQTPLQLTGNQLDRVARDNRLLVLVEAPGYIPRQLIFDLHGEDVQTILLSKFDSGYFEQRLLKDFHKDINLLTRELLRIQGLIMVRKLDEADRALGEFQRSFPNIAASYALSANIEMIRGNPIQARAYLLRAESMDPEDPAIQRALGQRIPTKAPTKTPAKAKAKTPRKARKEETPPTAPAPGKAGGSPGGTPGGSQ